MSVLRRTKVSASFNFGDRNQRDRKCGKSTNK